MPSAFWRECLYSIICVIGASISSSPVVSAVGWFVAGFTAGLAFAIYHMERAGL